MMIEDFPLPDKIRCLLSKDQQTCLWIGHCLEFDLVTSGESPEAAWKHLKSVVKLHIEHCFTNDRANLNRHRAPDEQFQVFDEGRNRAPFRSDKIDLNLIAPKVPDSKSFWIEGVELAFRAAASANLQAVH